ncbi:MAG: hypothetical protein ABUK06_01900 [Dehalococcoidales bacterium]
MAALALEYFALVFAASLGVFQAAAAYNGLRGLSFFSRPTWGYLFAAITTGPALAAIFTWNLRNATGIIEGGQQFLLLSPAILAAYLLTLVAASLLNGSSPTGDTTPPAGIEGFKQAGLFKLLRNRFGRKR